MGWNELSSRQKDLDRKIEKCGIKLDTSSSCLKSVMKAIGASASEAEYVRSRIALRLRTQAILHDTDDFIAHTEKMLDDFKKDDAEWERKGRKLGFKFWD